MFAEDPMKGLSIISESRLLYIYLKRIIFIKCNMRIQQVLLFHSFHLIRVSALINLYGNCWVNCVPTTSLVGVRICTLGCLVLASKKVSPSSRVPGGPLSYTIEAPTFTKPSWLSNSTSS